MVVRYHDSTAAARSAHGYVCAFYQVNYGTGGPCHCQHIACPALDAYVTSQVLEAVAPAAGNRPAAGGAPAPRPSASSTARSSSEARTTCCSASVRPPTTPR